MNIAKYRLELDEKRHNILVKESDLDYERWKTPGQCRADGSCLFSLASRQS